MNTRWIKTLFYLSALYDGALALAFLFAYPALFQHYGVTPPPHPGYVQFPALLLLLFAVMFVRIALAPALRRELIPYGIGLKASYCAVVFYSEVTVGIPEMWIPWAWLDLIFGILFILAWRQLKRA